MPYVTLARWASSKSGMSACSVTPQALMSAEATKNDQNNR